MSVATNHDHSASHVDNSSIIKKRLMISIPNIREAEPPKDAGIISIPRPAANILKPNEAT